MQEKNDPLRQTQQFPVGAPGEALALLWGRGDAPGDIAARFKISLDVVEEAIRLHGNKYPKRPKRRRHL